jgi:hypothetical protein
MRPVIVAPPDLADGFRLAGVAVYEIRSPEEIPQIVQRIREQPDVALVLVDERFCEGFERAFGGERAAHDRVVPRRGGRPRGDVYRRADATVPGAKDLHRGRVSKL